MSIQLIGTHVGKVRHTWIFSNGVRLMETTDRISAFDVVLPFTIPEKGRMLQCISQHFFSLTRSILPNHVIEAVSPQLMLVRDAKALPIEIIVRGFLTGSLWRSYQKDVELCNRSFGCKLAQGLPEGAAIEPLVTFTTKATTGHDETLNHAKTEELLCQWLNGHEAALDGHELFHTVLSKAKELYAFGSRYAHERGLILVDTKFEMGLDETRQLILIDECFTPDSSRYWPLAMPRTPLSKEKLREALLERFGAEMLEQPNGQERWARELRRDQIFMTTLANELTATYQQLTATLLGHTHTLQTSQTAMQFLETIGFEHLRHNTLFPPRILIVGNGGREHALYKMLASTRFEIQTIFTLEPQRSWGVPLVSRLVKTEFIELLRYHQIGCVIIGPEDALAAGVADWCADAQVAVLGPGAATARLESSKWYCKELAIAADVPTPPASLHSLSELKQQKKPQFPVVLKFDGLAAGKGVFVTSDAEAYADALVALESLCKNQEEKNILLEECIAGDECSAIALCSGTEFRLLPFARDHKRRFEHDEGPNTGGMGTFAPVELATTVYSQMKNTIEKLLQELQHRGTPFYGFLFCGFMIESTTGCAWLLECNTRLGDPETEVLLPSLNAHEFLAECLQVAYKRPFLFKGECFASDGKKRVYVVGTTDEYPAASQEQYHLPPETLLREDVFNHSVDCSGRCLSGRIIGCLGTADTFLLARKQAYETLDSIGLHKNGVPHLIACRRDIAGDEGLC